jgi:hypothetical protein
MKSLSGKFLLLLLCGFGSGISAAGGFTGWMKIESINQRDCGPNRGLEVTFATAHNNPDACTNSKVVEIDCSLTTYNPLLAIALTAKSAELEADAYVNGCDLDGQAKVTALKIR